MRAYLENLITFIKKKDPSIKDDNEIKLLAGYKAIKYYLKAHQLYIKGNYYKARKLSEKAKFKTGIEIHPGAKIGKNLFIDHGQAVVIGETAVIGNDVMIYHGVTLGAKKVDFGNRHPKIGNNVILGTGCIILGNICIGDNSVVGANAVVTKDVEPNTVIYGPKQIER